MKDIFGNTLSIGMVVATNQNGYLDTLVPCEIIGFTPMMVELKPLYGPNPIVFRKYPNQLAAKSVPFKPKKCSTCKK